MARANSDALLVQQHAQIRRVTAFQQEAEDAGRVHRGADASETLDIRGLLQRVLQQRLFMPGRCGPVEAVDIIDGRAQSDHTGNVGGAGLEFKGEGVESGSGERHGFDHFPTAEEGRHGVQQFLATPEHTDAGRAEQLVSGEGVEIAVQGLHVHRPVGHRLGTVYQDFCTDCVGFRYHLGHGIHGADGVGHVVEGDHLHALIQQIVQRFEIDVA